MPVNLSNYNEVKDRLKEFFEKYPTGSFQQVSVEVHEIAGQHFIAFTAAAYRTPDDERPAHGTAWEPVPGLTNYTRNSELQNAETSAWGRAIIAIGAADAQKGIATAEDVQSRAAEADAREAEEEAVGGLRSSLDAAIKKHIGDPPDEERSLALKQWFADNDLPSVRRMNAEQCDRVIDHLMSLPSASVGDVETGEPK